jgi:hypothetical protein
LPPLHFLPLQSALGLPTERSERDPTIFKSRGGGLQLFLCGNVDSWSTVISMSRRHQVFAL